MSNLRDRGSRRKSNGGHFAYLPLYVRDFLTDPDVLVMRWIDQAIYLRMLMASWEAGPLPDDEEMIVRLIGAQHLAAEVPALIGIGDPLATFSVHEAVRSVLDAAWELRDDGWVSARLEAERERAASLLGAQRGRTERAREALAAKRASVTLSVTETETGIVTGLHSQAQAQAQEEKEEPPKNPPKGGSSSRRQGKPRWKGSIPLELAGDVFAGAWERWLRFRASELRKPVTQMAGDQALRELAGWGVERAVRAIDHTIARGWQGLREPEETRRGVTQNAQRARIEDLRRKFAGEQPSENP